MKVLADTHVAPPLRRWLVRLGLAVVVAVAIGYAPGQLLSRDPRAEKLERQLAEEHVKSQQLAAEIAVEMREVEALRTDIGAIEDRARADLGMVYPDEIVFKVHRDEPTAAPTARPELAP